MSPASAPITVADVRRIVEEAYPPHLAESWDKVGLICGDPEAPVTKVALALDCTEQVAQAAVDCGAQFLLVHHPLLLKGTSTVAADDPKGRVLHTLIRGGVALMAAHTNADCARPGVNDHLAELLGITPGAPIVPAEPQALDKWGVYVPSSHVDQVQQALFDAGAGTVGAYDHCSWRVTGTGQFRPLAGAEPTEGTVGTVHNGAEVRVEFVAGASIRKELVAALRAAHPYEEPAFDICPMADSAAPESACGLGRVGTLDRELTLREFTQRVADALPQTVWGVRAAGDPDRRISTVAVCSGSGDSLLDTVRGLGVDAYVTSDLRHHPVDEYLRAGGPAVIDTAHWASEFPWTTQAAGIITEASGLDCHIIDIRTDPWTLSAHAQDHAQDHA